MPRSTREWAKRKLLESVQSINWAGYHLSQVIEKYEPSHKEVSEPLLIISNVMLELQETIKKVRESF